MSRDSSGTYTLPPGINPVVEGTPIEPTWANDTLSDLATAMSDSLSRSGKGGMLAPLKMANGSAAAPSYTFSAEPGAGFYRAGASDIRVAFATVDVMTWTPAGTTLSNITVTGNTILGDAAGDTLTIAPNAVTWSGNPTHSGTHTFSGTVQTNSAFLLNTTNCQIDLSSGNPRFLFDAGDSIAYDRTANSFTVNVGASALLTVNATDGPQRASDATTANGLTRKSQVDSAIATAVTTATTDTAATVAAANLDLATVDVFFKTVTADITFTVSNVASSGNVSSFLLELTNGGAFTVTWWAGVKWASGLAPTLTVSGVDILAFYTRDGGTTWRGVLVSRDVR